MTVHFDGSPDEFDRLLISILSPLAAKIDAVLVKLDLVIEKENLAMSGIKDVNDAEAAVHADLLTQNGLITQLLGAFATGAMTPAQAQALVTTMTADDASAKSNIAAIQTALGTAPAPVGPAPVGP